eukprot:gene5743-11002_t
MKVKLATQVFSHSVAAGINTYVSLNGLPSSAIQDFLTVRGVSVSNYTKVELVARAFSAAEMGLPIEMSSQDQAELLQQENFNVEYVGKYKDRKAYSYFDSSFVGEILVSKPKDEVILLLLLVRAPIHDEKELWVAA